MQSVISQFPLDSGVDASDMLRWNAPCEIAFFTNFFTGMSISLSKFYCYLYSVVISDCTGGTRYF